MLREDWTAVRSQLAPARRDELGELVERFADSSSVEIINGDATQIDLQGGASGLGVVEDILSDIEGISFVHLGGKDVVRHQIVQEIVEAYGRFGQASLPADD